MNRAANVPVPGAIPVSPQRGGYRVLQSVVLGSRAAPGPATTLAGYRASQAQTPGRQNAYDGRISASTVQGRVGQWSTRSVSPVDRTHLYSVRARADSGAEASADASGTIKSATVIRARSAEQQPPQWTATSFGGSSQVPAAKRLNLASTGLAAFRAGGAAGQVVGSVRSSAAAPTGTTSMVTTPLQTSRAVAASASGSLHIPMPASAASGGLLQWRQPPEPHAAAAPRGTWPLSRPGAAVPAAAAPEGPPPEDDARVLQVRDSLLQNIQSVQKEIERLNVERLRPAQPSRQAQRNLARHHAACRIQRAWRISRWRRRFVLFSERELGWVGSLTWLQEHNLLYGTELADPEDVKWWNLKRADAPLDREVDPWGSAQLQEHLSKMWYGRSPEELEAEAAESAGAVALLAAPAEERHGARQMLARRGAEGAVADPGLAHGSGAGPGAAAGSHYSAVGAAAAPPSQSQQAQLAAALRAGQAAAVSSGAPPEVRHATAGGVTAAGAAVRLPAGVLPASRASASLPVAAPLTQMLPTGKPAPPPRPASTTVQLSPRFNQYRAVTTQGTGSGFVSARDGRPSILGATAAGGAPAGAAAAPQRQLLQQAPSGQAPAGHSLMGALSSYMYAGQQPPRKSTPA